MSPSQERDASVASTARATDGTTDKAGKPDFFKGERSKLDDWINQMMMYFALNNIQNDHKKTMTAAFYMRGEAQNWIRPKLQKWLVERKDSDGLFSTWETFVDTIRSIYGLNNDKQVATRVVQQLTQKTSASAYTAKFKEYSDKTDWDDNALMTMYYRGLKENVKDEMMRDGAARDTLPRMIKAAIRIDDALYERSMEKRHTNSIRGRLGYVPYSGSGGHRRDPNAMEIDNTEKRPKKGRGNGGQKKGNTKPKKEGIRCYNCDKIGHYARDCRSGKMQPPKQREFNAILDPEEPGASANEARGAYDTTGSPKPEPAEHRVLHWSACYRDDCRTHYDGKLNAGWFPSSPRKEVSNTEKENEDFEERYHEATGHEYDWRYHDARDGAILVPRENNPEKEDWVTITDANERAQVNVIERAPTPGVGLRALQEKEAMFQARLAQREKEFAALVGQGEHQEQLLRVFDDVGRLQNRLEKVQQQIHEYPTIQEKVKEVNMVEVRQPRLEWDDGHHTRGRSPPPFAWEDQQPTQETPSSMMETDEMDYPQNGSQLIQLKEDYTKEPSQEIPESGSEEEYTDDEDPDDTELCTMTIESSSPVLRLIQLLAEDSGTVFPIVNGKRRLHPHRFDMMLERMRALLWTYRQVNVDWDAYKYVVDKPPMGSKFDAKTGGYTAPDGVAISRPMREWVKVTKQRFKEIQQIQEKWFEDEIEYRDMKNELVKAIQNGPMVAPDTTMTPVWRGMTLGHLRTTTKGPVTTRFSQGKVVFMSKPGPLQWEVCVEDSNSPTYFSKN